MTTKNAATSKTDGSHGNQARARDLQPVRKDQARQSITVRLAMWGPQDIDVTASTGGGQHGRAYIAVRTGQLLTYLYDTPALDSHVLAWLDADRTNRALRLIEHSPQSAHQRHPGTDLAIACQVSQTQARSITGQHTPAGRPLLTVTIGAVTLDLHTPSALRTIHEAWLQASKIGDLLPERAYLPPT